MLKQTQTTLSKIEEIKKKATKSEIRELKLDQAERIANHLDIHSSKCVECKTLTMSLRDEAVTLSNQSDFSSSDILAFREFQQGLSNHLKRSHNKVQPNTGLSLGLGMGVAGGLMLGQSVFGDLGLGIALGVALGLPFGAWWDKKARNSGRMI